MCHDIGGYHKNVSAGPYFYDIAKSHAKQALVYVPTKSRKMQVQSCCRVSICFQLSPPGKEASWVIAAAIFPHRCTVDVYHPPPCCWLG